MSTTSTYTIDAQRTPRGSVMTGWSTDGPPVVEDLAEEVGAAMRADKGIASITVTVEVTAAGDPEVLAGGVGLLAGRLGISDEPAGGPRQGETIADRHPGGERL